MLAALHPMAQNPQLINQYRQFENEVNLQGIEMPMRLFQVPKFEKQNEISINVFGYEEGVYPLHISSFRFPNLLLITDGEQNHYCLIRDLSRLLNHQSQDGHKTFVCPYCLHRYTRQDLLDKHKHYCQTHTPQRIEMPSETEKILKFKHFPKKFPVGFVIYADFECILEMVNPTVDKTTTVVEKHIPCGYCYKIVSTNEKYTQPPVVYHGENAVTHFLMALNREEQKITKLLKEVKPMKLTPEDEQAFQRATVCHICDLPLNGDKVRDHDHLLEGNNYRGAAHNSCNLNFKHPTFIPVVMHNAKGYDSHLILSQVEKLKPKRISCIAQNKEKYIGYSIGRLR